MDKQRTYFDNVSAVAQSDTASPAIIRAALYMVCSALLFGLMTVVIRLASKQLHPFQIAFFRNFFGLMFALPLLWQSGFALLRTDKLSLYFMRCVIGMISMLAGFWAIAHLPLAQAVAISYSTPLFVTIGAVLVLGEVVRVRRWTAVIVGFFGVLLIVRPGGMDFSYNVWVALLAAALSGAVAVSIKVLSRTEPVNAIVFYTTLIWVPLSLIPALAVWQWPDTYSLLLGVAAGFLGTAGHMFWTRALRLGDVSMLTPISFVQLPIVAIFAYFLFGETLDIWMVAGSLIIFASIFYIAQREAALAKRSAKS